MYQATNLTATPQTQVDFYGIGDMSSSLETYMQLIHSYGDKEFRRKLQLMSIQINGFVGSEITFENVSHN